jgi:putative transposase
LATNAARRITAAGTMAVLDQIREHRGAPQFLRMDNGPEFITDTLCDWCKEQNIKANYCDPGSPWQNGRIESCNSGLRDELLTREVFDSTWEIRSYSKNTTTTPLIDHKVLGLIEPQPSSPLNGRPKTVC